MKICFATNNANKLKEIRQLLGSHFEVQSLKDIGCEQELPENQDTLEGNSAEKARFVYDDYGIDCFADDTGLEVKALNGEPGVYSARYAGPQRSSEDNMQRLLEALKDKDDRTAQFRTVITLILSGEQHQFEGIVSGRISEGKSGSEGFGYDPIFVPDGYTQSFAEMDMATKNKISHRGLATKKLVAFLKQI
ncbi:XTP/dITP diphosphohydrolase [Catalinimonas alkaloidigena]|uniref:non-canonical purine NTP diphosphatase n=1 Tax=Catalinimonas alkaloidigena TaxID=1075417 RepID=UPI002404AA03|nr:non-canonical purine NTP diphosphatase [Catalinimonas alkaloidigena]MDF9800204.1 XTP/dITP diphosphohydrolase [Catalinimonas alkaloidigena]